MSEPLVRHSLQWSLRHTEPPAGWPRILAEEILPRSMPSRVVSALWYPGCGYSCHWSPLLVDEAEPRKLSTETKQRIRRKSLARRIEKTAPLFAGDLLRTELERKPDYYGK